MPWAEQSLRTDVAGPALLPVLMAAIISLMLALAVTVPADASPGQGRVVTVSQFDLHAPAPGHLGLGHGAPHACHAAGCTATALATTAIAVVVPAAHQSFPPESRIVARTRPVGPGLKPPIA